MERKRRAISKKNSSAVPATNLEQIANDEQVQSGKPAPLDTQCSIHIHSRRHTLADADGVSAKAVIDGLVHAGLLEDDSPKYVSSISYSQEKIPKSDLEETIVEVWVNE